MEKVFPMDIYPMQLLKACMAEWKYNIGDKILDRMIYENHLDPLQMNNLSHLESYNVLMDSLGKKIDNQIIDNQ